MYLSKILDPAGRAHRVRFAIANILRDRVAHEGAFRNCFEMEDAHDVIRAILERGLKNAKLRAALRASHLIELNQWLALYPDFAEPYFRLDCSMRGRSRPNRN